MMSYALLSNLGRILQQGAPYLTRRTALFQYIVYKTKPATRGCYSHSKISYYPKNKWRKKNDLAAWFNKTLF